MDYYDDLLNSIYNSFHITIIMVINVMFWFDYIVFKSNWVSFWMANYDTFFFDALNYYYDFT